MISALLYGFVPWYLRTVLLMTLAGSALVLFVLVILRFFGSRFSKAGAYRLWKVTLLGFLIPFSLFLSLPVRTPVTGLQNGIERTADAIFPRDYYGRIQDPATQEEGGKFYDLIKTAISSRKKD